ncbi:MAG: IS481 family transposase, partial [Actinomycetales bacterium]
MARFHVESGSTIRATAERYQVSTTTVLRWSRRYRQVVAEGGVPAVKDMMDVSSRPHRSPTRTRPRLVRKVKHLRTKKRLGPVQIAGRVGMPASTVHAVLVREGMNRLDRLDRVTGQDVRRYEDDAPGGMVHMDVKKFGLIPAGGGWKVHGRSAMAARRAKLRGQRRPAGWARNASSPGRRGYAYVHSVIDDHSRLAYSEVHDDETTATVLSFWARAIEFYASHGITIARVMTDNGPAYCSHAFAEALHGAGIKHRRTKAYRPQTNGKVERYQRTLRDEWGYARAYASESARRKALPRWLHHYNH